MVDIDSCNDEPVQFMDSIQGFGALLVLDRRRQIIQAASGSLMNTSLSKILGKSFDQTYPDISRTVWATLGERSEPTVPMLIKSGAMHQWLTCIAHKSDDYTIVELEPFTAGDDIALMKLRNDRDDTLESYLSYIVENLQAATGFDRVMAYKFATDWHGEVVAEALAPNSLAHSFSGHHFPASDIPAPARELFRKNWVRIIANVDEPAIPIQSVSQPREAVDLGRSALRAPSPIHIEYLQIMAVKASMTMSLICDGKLWGLLACHHLSPKLIEAQHRSLLGLMAKLISSRITTISANSVRKASDEVTAFLKTFNERLQDQKELLTETVRDHKVDLRNMIKSDGFAYLNGAEIVNDGNMPSRDNLHSLRQYLDKSGRELFATSEIAQVAPTLRDLSAMAAGVLAVKINQNWFIWTRIERGQTLTWAGNPDTKNLYQDREKLRMSPRLSLESWKQQSQGRSEDWQQSEVDAAQLLKTSIFEIQTTKHWTSSVPAQSYIRVLRQSIDAQAADLQKHFERKDLMDMVEEAAKGNPPD